MSNVLRPKLSGGRTERSIVLGIVHPVEKELAEVVNVKSELLAALPAESLDRTRKWYVVLAERPDRDTEWLVTSELFNVVCP